MKINDDEILLPETPFPIEGNLILLARRGSEAHGTWIPPTDPTSIDDRDLMGIVIPPIPYYLGLQRWEGAESIQREWDVVFYELRKFVRLLCKQNPNVLGMLWLDESDYVWRTQLGNMLIQNRLLFRHRQAAYDSFVGYARGQFQKMQHGQVGGYMGARRKELVQRFGHDCKNASHLIRLLHTGLEYLLTGEIQVRRTWDVDTLIAIKRGEWSLERVKGYAERQFESMEAALAKSDLPEQIDMARVEEIVVQMLRGHLAA